MSLSEEQQAVLDAVKGGKVKLIFLRAPAGTGKTYTVEEICKVMPNVIRAAPTAQAATLIGGATIHKVFGIPTYGALDCNKSLWDLRSLDKATKFFGGKRREPLKAASWFILDEAPMIRCDHMDFIEKALRATLRDPQEAFGGGNILFVGDDAQLPPVVTTKDEEQLLAMGYEAPFDFTKAKVFTNS